MPLVSSSPYRPPFYLFNGHLQTIVPSLLREVPEVQYQRQRVETPDGDFLDLDWSRTEHVTDTLGIISHGLEGDAGRPYVRGMARALNKAGIDALAWNYRSCSGEPNRLLRAYHLGDTDDLHFVVQQAVATGRYRRVFLTGFSAGGNMTLKYLGEDATRIPREVERAAVFSVPTDLKAGSEQISRMTNRIYLNRFLKSLRLKIRQKAELLPGQLDLEGLEELSDFPQFDNRFTAPMHGFASADEYYERSSSGRYLDGIRVPTLLVNAQNDPFLAPTCFPRAAAERSPYVFLETPEEGGHVGFSEGTPDGEYYSERRAVAFLTAPVPA
ncbi:alpha/beta fold hydrolase [Hymenobacter busanensis]|uniref:Alpha/beta fold hydrolase n=1 Tax=Hymenobacter busanensis TaxID=2607656 RepID=A0A7L4ZX96_9BACT|nr:alpha/beta fold hydrolase [Hymenobacter busanensis]KAA9332207.1 alpha/beta fold hydrolase [Hymenobacter busanensis]QHJ07455.1 alpha/beta fold hydrolase [Hymenobacter busanensis]